MNTSNTVLSATMALDEESETDCNAYKVMVQCSDCGHHLLDQMSIEQPARPDEQPVADRDEVGTLLALLPILHTAAQHGQHTAAQHGHQWKEAPAQHWLLPTLPLPASA